MRIALDTNVLACAEGVKGAAKKSATLDVLAGLGTEDVLIPVQVLGELFRVLVGKAGRPAAEARAALLSWRDAFAVIATSPPVMLSALDLAMDHRLGIWDSVILAAAADAECRLLLSDMQDGFTWGGVTVANPFAPTLSPLLAPLLPSK